MKNPPTDARAALIFPPALFGAAALFFTFAHAPAQSPKQPPAAAAPPAPRLKRAESLRETRRLGYGGKVTLYGAPDGSISVEGWPRGEFELSADVELRADAEEDLARLASVNRFLLSDDLNHVRVVTTGTHDRAYMKRAAKNFPKKLLNLPWRLDYKLRVPAASDLELYAGRGPLRVEGVEGALRVNAGEADAAFVLTGGDVEATVRRGALSFRVAARSWRGRGANVRLGEGALTVELPANFYGDLDADLLRGGRVENTHPALAPREGEAGSEKSLRLRGGGGGAKLTFVVGEGTLRIVPEGGAKR